MTSVEEKVKHIIVEQLGVEDAEKITSVQQAVAYIDSHVKA
jgi:acyl carrier protein